MSSVEENTNTVKTVASVDRQLSQQEKIVGKIESLELALVSLKKAADIALLDVRGLKKQAKKLKSQKNKKVVKTDRKPHGFAVPSVVSDELCAFMNVPSGTLVSRTEVTKRLTSYISENNLQNPENRKQILPDATMRSLFGEAAKDVFLTHFTMQKYMNHHFKKTVKDVVV